MARKATLGAWAARIAAGCTVVASIIAMSAAPASAASNRLGNGKKLTAGHCIVDKAGTSTEAKFCVGKNYNINLYYKGRICWTWQAAGHLSGPSAYVRVAANGDVEFFQYAGGRRLWHSGTTAFRGADLVIGSHLYGHALIAVDTGSAFFTIRTCH
jgi:hypothetical protein